MFRGRSNQLINCLLLAPSLAVCSPTCVLKCPAGSTVESILNIGSISCHWDCFATDMPSSLIVFRETFSLVSVPAPACRDSTWSVVYVSDTCPVSGQVQFPIRALLLVRCVRDLFPRVCALTCLQMVDLEHLSPEYDLIESTRQMKHLDGTVLMSCHL